MCLDFLFISHLDSSFLNNSGIVLAYLVSVIIAEEVETRQNNWLSSVTC